jgi:succinoglycan biosynthesis protein ExoL
VNIIEFPTGDTTRSRMKISYFVHDIGHPDLARRLGMLREGGAEVTVFGFHRMPRPDADLASKIIDLGRTIDARFTHRAWAVARAAPRLRLWADEIAPSKVILARNLEMLFLAAVARRLYAPRASLVYECLDIHRLMLSNGMAGAAVRLIEGSLLKRSQGLIVSSPGFIREYFEKNHRALPKSFVLENKVLSADGGPGGHKGTIPPGPPWRIGWFGLLRCRRSLDILSQVVQSAPELVEVVLAGRPSTDVFKDIKRDFQITPGLKYIGPYKDEAALAALFASVHFAWSIDYYEAGANSAWLLPNRLYRAALYGSVPVAMTNVETGRWLAAHGAGVLLDEPAGENLVGFLKSMTPGDFARIRTDLGRIPRAALVTEPEECQAVVRELGRLTP